MSQIFLSIYQGLTTLFFINAEFFLGIISHSTIAKNLKKCVGQKYSIREIDVKLAN